MNEVLKMSRKTLTATVVAATIAWSIGLSSLVAPLTARAAASGSLVKASLPAVYYVGSDAKRYVFPNEKTYKTWYSDFSSVQTITDAELAAMPIGGNATYKPGVKMVKITTDPKVYAVDKGGALRWVKTEALAVALYGADWNKKIDDVPDAFFTNYTVGSDVAASSDFVPATATAAASSINADKSLASGGSGTLTGVSAMLSSSGPAGGVLPKGATQVNFLKFDVKNGTSASVTLDSLTVHRTGAGTSADFANVYVYDGASRLTTGRSVNSSSNDSTFGGLNLTLAAGETHTLWIAADMATGAGAGNTNAFQLTALSSGASAVAGLPLAGPTFTGASASSGSVTISRSGSSPLSNVKAGGLKQKIAEFQLLAGASEDVNFTKIALFRGGAVSRDNVTNIVLTQAGTTVATATGFDSHDRVALMLSTPMLIERGNTKTFEVWADIGASARAGTSETILTYLDQNTDLLAVGATYGYGVQVDSGTTGTYNGTSCALGAGNCSSTRVEGGQLTVTFNGPAAKNVGINAKNVELYNFTMAAQSNLEIRNLRTQITWAQGSGNALTTTNGLVDTSGVAAANFKNIKIVDTASSATVAGPKDVDTAGNDTTQALVYTETINLSAGQSRTFKVLADVANQSVLANNTVRFDLSAFGASDVRNLDNSTYIATTDIVPNSGTNGNADTLVANSVTVAAASTPVTQNMIQGSQGVALAGFTLKAGDAGDMKVSSITLQGQINSDDGSSCTASPNSTWVNGQQTAACASVATLVQSVKLWNGSTQLGATKSPAASSGVGLGGTVTFDSLGLTVPQGQTVTLTLTGNLASGQTAANMPDRLRWQVTAANQVSATDKDGNSSTALGSFAVSAPGGNGIVVQAAGSVTVTLAPDDTDSEAGIAVGGSSNVVLGKYKFSATNEELKLTKARVTTAGAAGISNLSLYDGSTLVGGPVSPDFGGTADFTGVNFVIPKDGTKVLTVKANLNSVSTSGVTSGTVVTVTLDAAANFEVRGTSAGSNTLLTTFAGTPLAANVKVMRKSKPTITLVALPSSVLTAGSPVVMRFTISADAAGDVSVKHINLTVTKNSASGTLAVTGGGVTDIRRVGDSTNLAGVSDLTSGVLSETLNNEEVIAAGTSRTYDVRLTVAGTLSNGDSVASNLAGDGAVAGTTTGLPAGANPAFTVNSVATAFGWSDMSASAHTDGGATYTGATADFASGRYLKVLPSDSQTLSK